MIGSLVHRVVRVCRLPPLRAFRQRLSQWLRRCRGVLGFLLLRAGRVERYLFGHFVYMNSYTLTPPHRPLVGEWLQGQMILALHLPLLVFRTRGVGALLNDSDLGLCWGC